MASNGLSERLQTPISTAELQRRWAAVRAAMAREKIDVLLMQNNNDHMGGYVKYFTDMPATNGYPNTVVFPKDDEMTVVCQGPFNGDGKPPGDIWRGVKRMLTTPSYESAHYTQYYDPELAAKALQPYAKATIGFVGIYQMSFAMGDYIMKKFPGAKFVDASEMVDRIKVIKSPEELELVKRCAIMQDGAMKAAFAAIKPGMRDTEVAAVAAALPFRSITVGAQERTPVVSAAPEEEQGRGGGPATSQAAPPEALRFRCGVAPQGAQRECARRQH